MKPRLGILLFVLWMVVSCISGCGKKSPPFLPERTMPLVVKQLEAEWRDNMVLLKGSVIDPEGNKVAPVEISGCRIYHAAYALENPPCEDCPIQYSFIREIREMVIFSDGFSCQVSDIDKKGFHFFRVRLLDRKGAVGPVSNGAKVRIE